MVRGNIFANIENEFQFATKEQIIEMGKIYRDMLVQLLSVQFDDATTFGILVHAAKMGTAGDGVLDSDEKRAIKEILGEAWAGPISMLYDAVSVELVDQDYQSLENVIKLGNNVAMPFLRLILAFAYIDGTIEDDMAGRLEVIYGTNLLTSFTQSDLESVPEAKIKVTVTKLELNLINWMKEKDEAYQLKDIVAAFPSYTKKDIVKALDSLSEKDVVIGKGKLVDGIYSLNGYTASMVFETKEENEKRNGRTTNQSRAKKDNGNNKTAEVEASKYGVSVEELPQHKKYLKAKELMDSAEKAVDYSRAVKAFEKIGTYKDALALSSECEKRCRELKQTEQIQDTYDEAVKVLKEAQDSFEEEKEEYFSLKEQYDAITERYNEKNAGYGENIKKIEEKYRKIILNIDQKIIKNHEQIEKHQCRLEELSEEYEDTIFFSRRKKNELKESIDIVNDCIEKTIDSLECNKKEIDKCFKKCEEEKEKLLSEIQMIRDEANSLVKKINKQVDSVNEAQHAFEAAEKKVKELELEYGSETILELKKNKAKKEQKEKLEAEEAEKKRLAKRTLEQKRMEDIIMPTALYNMERLDKPVTVSELADYMSMTIAEVASALNKLNKQGKVERYSYKGKTFYNLPS